MLKLFTRMPTILRSPSFIRNVSTGSKEWLLSKGYSDAVADGIIRAIKETTPDNVSSGYNDVIAEGMIKAMSGTGADITLMPHEFLTTLSEAVARDLEKAGDRKKNKVVTIHVKVPAEKHEFTIKTCDNDNLYNVCAEPEEELKQYLECACSGNAACSTCHVYVDDDLMKVLEPAEENEQDMLDLAFNSQPNSRLGCQMKITKACDGMTLTIPTGSHNLYG